MTTNTEQLLPEVHVGRLPTMNQDPYPSLGSWWVQLWDGRGDDAKVVARVYGNSPEQAVSRAEAFATLTHPAQLTQPAEGGEAVQGIAWQSNAWSNKPLTEVMVDGHRWYRHDDPKLTAPPTSQEQADALTGCNCRWKGETQVEWCEHHRAHLDAIHEWAQRAKAAEAKLKASQEQAQQPIAEHEKDCATCAHQSLPAYMPKCAQCNRLATGARRNWQAQQPSRADLEVAAKVCDGFAAPAMAAALRGQQPSGGGVVAYVDGIDLLNARATVTYTPNKHGWAPFNNGDALTLATPKPEPR